MPSPHPSPMTRISIAGGLYSERCIWPEWDQVFGSAGRAACALAGHVDQIALFGYADAKVSTRFQLTAELNEFDFRPVSVQQSVSFDYLHCLAVPIIHPAPSVIVRNAPISVTDESVLRFGMLEGTAIVQADRCVYDPQSAFAVEPFSANGSHARRLAIVANRSEIIRLGQNDDPEVSAHNLLAEGAEVVVVKSGAAGALVVNPQGTSRISAYQSDNVWTIGSGDVFAAIFSAEWAVNGNDPREAAEIASRAVANYAGSMALPSPLPNSLKGLMQAPVSVVGGKMYLASPFFTISQRWLVDEARKCLRELGLSVFSPVHDIGPGPAETVAPADLAALDSCDCVFAVLDGLDSGTIFEVGYARAIKKPVYALAQTVSNEDLKMISGSGCRVFDDFVTALHHAAWRT